eukprot:5625929-Amphidinium_carterae.2
MPLHKRGLLAVPRGAAQSPDAALPPRPPADRGPISLQCQLGHSVGHVVAPPPNLPAEQWTRGVNAQSPIKGREYENSTGDGAMAPMGKRTYID